MTDTNQPTGAPGTDSPNPNAPARGACCRGRGRGALAIAGILVAGALIGTFATKAFSHGPFGHHRHGHGSAISLIAGPGGAIDPAEAEARIERMARHFGVEANATKEQQDKLNGIARAAAKDLLPMRETMQSGRKRMVELLSATTIDRAAIETLRTEQLSLADSATKRLSQAIADTAEVLSPEQRKVLAERAEKFREHRGWAPWRKG